MDIRISVEELQKGLQRAQGIVDRKATMPILANVLLDAADDRVTLRATDLELGLSSEHPAEVNQPGRITIAAKNLLDIVRNLPESHVTLTRQPNNWVQITSGRARFRIVGQAPEDFPNLPTVEEAPLGEIGPDLLGEMFRKTQYAVSTDETRYNLNGVYVEHRDGKLRMVATDGHRLALVERDFEADLGLTRGVIVPRKGLAEMNRLLAERPESVSLGFTAKDAVFRIEGLVLTMHLVDGQFPDYEQVIPEGASESLEVARETFLSTLKRVKLVASDRAPAVRLQLEPGRLTVVSENPDLGEASEELEVDYQGPALKVGFNAAYLIDVIGVLSDERVRISVSDELSPAVVSPAGVEGYTAVVMPMRI